MFSYSLTGSSKKEDFESLLNCLLDDFQKMMESTNPTNVGTQARDSIRLDSIHCIAALYTYGTAKDTYY